MSVFDTNLVQREIPDTLFRDWTVHIFANDQHPLLQGYSSPSWLIEWVDKYIKKMYECGVDIKSRITMLGADENSDKFNYLARITTYILQDIGFTEFHYEDREFAYFKGYYLNNCGARFKNRIGKRCREVFNIPKNGCIGKNNTHFNIWVDSHSYENPFNGIHYIDFVLTTYSTSFDKKQQLFKLKFSRPDEYI